VLSPRISTSTERPGQFSPPKYHMPSEDSICIPQIQVGSIVFDELPTHYPGASITVYICIHCRSHVKADIQILCRPRLLYIQVSAVKASGRYSPSYLCQFPLQVSCMSFCQLTITACTPLTQISPSDPRVPGGILICSGARSLLWLAASILILE